MTFPIVHTGNESSIQQIQSDLFFRVGSLEKRDQCNTGIVVLQNSVALIDYPAQSPAHEIIDEAEKLTGLSVKYLIFTHPHSDHVDGIKKLQRSDISILASKGAVEYLYHKGYFPPPIHRVFDHTETYELDGRTLQFHIPEYTAHSPWDMMVGIPEAGVLFTGDLLALPKNMFLHTADLEGWIIAVGRIMESGWQYIARGHGSIIKREEADETLIYLRLLNQARLWQMRHHEIISPASVENAETCLSRELSEIVKGLLSISDSRNVSRQINQAHYLYK